MSLLLGEHRRYLADVARLDAYRTALGAVIEPGATVLDLGSGTGVLAVLALEAGAGHVYAVDGSRMLAVARAILTANGLADRVTFVKGHSQRVELPQRVDVVVADQLGAFGLEAGLLAAFADARARHLKPGGVLLPHRLDLVAAPATSPALWDEVSFWDEPVDGIDVRAVQGYARNVRYFTTSAPEDLLGPATVLASLDPGDPAAAPIEARAVLPVERAGTLHGLAAWFAAELAPGTTVSNGPVADRLNRSNVFLPLGEPLKVQAGDEVRLELHVEPPDALTRWVVTVCDAAGTERAVSRHSTAEGTPITREDLRRTRPDHVPTLSPLGRARVTALSLFDGEHTLAEIEAMVWSRHRDVFRSAGDAAAFVTQLVTTEAP